MERASEAETPNDLYMLRALRGEGGMKTLCCILGSAVSGAGLIVMPEPYRQFFLGLMVWMLGGAIFSFGWFYSEDSK
jgi:hypothetical protein